MWLLVRAAAWVALALVLAAIVLGVYFRVRRWCRGGGKVVAFFHPFCNDGGGGERVLWRGVNALKAVAPSSTRYIVYTGDEVSDEEIISNVSNRFGIKLAEVEFVHLKKRHWVEAARYPRFTLIGQSLGSVVLALEALFLLNPEVFVDTTGYAFTYPIARWLGGCTVAAYVHYPTISTDMLDAVSSRKAAHNNSSEISQSVLRSRIKWVYYKLFSFLYGFAGNRADVVMVNSTWTSNHIKHLWGDSERTHIVYPPCNTNGLEDLPLQGRKNVLLSIAQFRPEKNHMLQLEAFAKLLEMSPALRGHVTLVIAGAVRHEGDQERYDALQHAAKERFGLGASVVFKANVSFEELRQLFATAAAGIHTMWNEHFGIGVVEMMAAGLATVAHDSGGPKADIIVPLDGKSTGLLAATAEEYAERLAQLFPTGKDGEAERMRMAANGRRGVSNRFSDKTFDEQFARYVLPFVSR